MRAKGANKRLSLALVAKHSAFRAPHWRGWLKPENRCLVPFNSFAAYAPEPNPEKTIQVGALPTKLATKNGYSVQNVQPSRAYSSPF
jgi:hypothetical protein